MKKNLLVICTILFTLNLTAAAQVIIVPINGIPPTLTPVTINAGAGDQNDPHISGDWVAYSSDHSIRYYNFTTNTDAEIPLGNSARDLLSDISGSKIVFSRIIAGDRTAVMVFDAATPLVSPIEIDAAPATIRIGSAIGGNTVAYIDFGLETNGELVIHDLTTSSSVRITNDLNPDQSPSVSPDGKVVTWEHCNSSLSNCDIWQAVKAGAVWNVGVVADTTNPEANPDTNGTLVVYDSFRAGSGNIFWRTVAGGAEVQLQMASFASNPSIAGNFIAFETRQTLGSTTDIFVYDIAANLLYQITNTPGVTEQLNDITLLPDCRIRVVWASNEDGNNARNIKAATFSLSACANFSGFLQPVENLPILNVVNAGQAVPVKFSLSGNKGLNIFAAGYPISSQIACDANEPGSNIEETVTAGGSSLSYDAAADRYTYVWKTNTAWKGTCRILALRLTDGSDHFAKFRFR